MLAQLLITAKSEDSHRRGRLMLKKRLLFIHTDREQAQKANAERISNKLTVFWLKQNFWILPEGDRLISIKFLKKVVPLFMVNKTAIDWSFRDGDTVLKVTQKRCCFPCLSPSEEYTLSIKFQEHLGFWIWELCFISVRCQVPSPPPLLQLNVVT